ncbi:MAG: threonine--tRNA ligase [Candidatus Hodarchaeales archaeon]|jgi:threonyl-tRNA synthetase
MKLLLVHSDGFSYQVKDAALKNPEKLEVEQKSFKTGESVLVVFSSVEKEDEVNQKRLVSLVVPEVLKAAAEVKEKFILLYPWVHLSQSPASPAFALGTLEKIVDILKEKDNTLNVLRAPFGYYKAFNLHCKGHPLAERSKTITVEPGKGVVEIDKAETEDLIALVAEEETKTEFYVLDLDGTLVPSVEYKFKKDQKKFKKFVSYETDKDRTVSEPPVHAALMRKLKLVDYVDGSDAGNLRWPPSGYIIKRILEKHVENALIEYGAFGVETPLIYSYTHPSLKKYLQRFPSRQYVVRSGDKDFFMRFSACFGQFLLESESIISYKNLPLKMYEFAASFRREQSGEIAALRRLRAFTMPDMHTTVLDMEMAKKCFREQYEISFQMMKDFELDKDIEVAFRSSVKFFENNKEWILGMMKITGKPILLELYKKRFAYYEVKFEFNFVDSQDKAAALSTVQIDVENSERFNMMYVDKDGEKKYPLLLHTSTSGAIERIVYAMLERAHELQRKGIAPSLPTWTSPVQVTLIPVTSGHLEKCQEIASVLMEQRIRTLIDDRELTVGKAVRDAEKLWTPYILVVGDQESVNMVTVRVRGQKEQLKMSLQEFLKRIIAECQGKPMMLNRLPIELSKHPIW